MRAWCRIARRCFFGMRRQMSQAVRARPIGPARRRLLKTGTGKSLALRGVVLVVLVGLVALVTLVTVLVAVLLFVVLALRILHLLGLLRGLLLLAWLDASTGVTVAGNPAARRIGLPASACQAACRAARCDGGSRLRCRALVARSGSAEQALAAKVVPEVAVEEGAGAAVGVVVEEAAAAEEEEEEEEEWGRSGLARQTRSAAPARRLGTRRPGPWLEARARLVRGGARSGQWVGEGAGRGRQPACCLSPATGRPEASLQC